MVTIRRYMNLGQAEGDKAVLESEGIAGFISGASSAALGYGSILGEVGLQVSDEDLDRAREVLAEHEAAGPLPDDFIPPEEPAQPPAGRGAVGEPASNSGLAIGVVILLVLLLMGAYSLRTNSGRHVRGDARAPHAERAK